MTLKTCSRADCTPIEQIRGEMGPGDYYDVITSNPPGAELRGGVPEAEKYGIPQGTPAAEVAGVNQAHIVEMSDDGKSDVRICCKTCGKATPWNRSDAPGMPGIGKVFTRNLWDEQV